MCVCVCMSMYAHWSPFPKRSPPLVLCLLLIWFDLFFIFHFVCLFHLKTFSMKMYQICIDCDLNTEHIDTSIIVTSTKHFSQSIIALCHLECAVFVFISGYFRWNSKRCENFEHWLTVVNDNLAIIMWRIMLAFCWFCFESKFKSSQPLNAKKMS